MKTLVTILSLIILLGCAPADEEAPENLSDEKATTQESIPVVPDAVKAAFGEMFPDIKVEKWEKEGEMYEVEFKMDSKNYEAEFGIDGKWLATEYEIGIEELPAAVTDKIKTDYPGYEIEEADFVNSAKLGEVYEVEFEKDGKEIEIYIDKDGKILATETEEAEVKDDEDDD